jgi:hypothetical protein
MPLYTFNVTVIRTKDGPDGTWLSTSSYQDSVLAHSVDEALDILEAGVFIAPDGYNVYEAKFEEVCK